MKSLTDLNTASDELLTYTDLRTAKVTFDRETPTNQSIGFVLGEYVELPIGINIIDIVLPDYEDVYFDLDISNRSTATVTFPTLPTGYTVDNYGPGRYRVSNIQSSSDWDAIKNVRITTTNPASFTFSAIIGYESSKTKTWTIAAVNTQRALLTASTSLTATGRMSNVVASSVMASTSSLSAALTKYKRTGVALTSTANLTVNYLAITFGTSALTSTSSLVANNTVTSWLNGLDTTSYYSNTATAIFNGLGITLEDGINPYADKDMIFTINPSYGEFGTTASKSSTFTITGNNASLESQLNNVLFYPTKNYTGDLTFTITFFSSVLGIDNTFTVRLLYAGSSPSYLIYDLAGGTSGTWAPSLADLKYYTLMDFVVVGGGGPGAGLSVHNNQLVGSGGGGGGGAGAVIDAYNQQLTNTSVDYSVGLGGQTWGQTNGNSTNFGNYVCPGGLRGLRGELGMEENGYGGNSANNYLGGISHTFGSNSTFKITCGGGAGASGNGGDGSSDIQLIKGGTAGTGITVSSTGLSGIYAIGGRGGSYIYATGSIGQGGDYPTGGAGLGYGNGGTGAVITGQSNSYARLAENGGDGIIRIKLHN